jgi:uncharacterized repeat protein (TIGR01451 family)/fimbrial isopeptide formation D2 family protein
MDSNRKNWKPGRFLMVLTPYGLRIGFPLLLLFALLLGAVYSAQAATVMCSDFGGVVDGNNPATFAAIQSASSFGIDMDCVVKNFPQSVGGFPITNINFQFPGQQSYYIAFLNVYYYGHMSCNDPTHSTFWIYWAPGGYNNISPSCQAFMVPVDAVLKKDPPAQTIATIGVPFTYTITVPLLGQLDSSGIFHYIANTDSADVVNAVITDDLSATGASLTYVSNTAYLVDPNTGSRTPLNGGLPLTLGASSTWLANHPGVLSDSTKHLVFSYEYNPSLALLPANNNVEIDLTVVVDNNPVNTAQRQFANTANMWFNKTINGTGISDLEAETGTTAPMTIVEPNLVVTKTSSMSNLNVGTKAPYTINVQNTGGSDAWNTVITDNIPAGMCVFDPSPTITAQVFAADGVTPVSGPLVSGTDFSVTWNGGTASACQLSLNMLTAAAKIGPTQRLIINYQAMLDAGTASGTFTNVAGATRWFSADNSYVGRREYDRTLTNGTPGVLDFQDAYTMTAAVAGYYFLKSVDDLTTGAYPATAAFPGDRLRYTLQIQNFNIPPLNNISVTDDLGALNGFTAFVPGSLSLASTNLPAGTYTVCPTCGTNGAGTITISGLTLGSNVQYQIQVDVTLAGNLTNGTIVRNQASLTGTDSGNKVWSGGSDDPSINGPALLGTPSDITPVLIQAPGALSKASPTPSNATIGQQFSYLITVPAAPASVPMYDVHILDTLPANVSFVSAQTVSGGTWNVTNTGTPSSLVLQDTNTGINIPAGGQAVIKVTVALQNTTMNKSGVTFTNSASYTYNKLLGGGGSTQGTGGAGVSTPMTVVEPHLTVTKTVSYASPVGKPSTDPAAAGDILQYTITMTNDGNSIAFDADVIDTLPPNVSLVSGSATAQINGSPVSGFLANPTTLPGGALDWGGLNGDGSLDIPINGKLVLTFQAKVLAIDGTPIGNTVYSAWTSLDGILTSERTGEGCPNITQPNNYCSGPATATVSSLDPTALVKSVDSDTWSSGLSTSTDQTLRIGDTVIYSLALTLREGVTQNVVVTDALPAGLSYDSLVGITPASGSNFTYTVSSQPAAGATGTLTWNLGNITNAVDNNPANNTLVIQYRVKVVKNTLVQTPVKQQLANNAAVNYAINGVAAAPKTSGATINVWQPMLGVSKSAAPAAGGTIINTGELITYTINIANSGASPAYDPVLTDTLPVGLRQNGVTTTSVALLDTTTNTVLATLPILPNPYFSYNSSTGVASWNFDTGVANAYAIPPGETLQVVYQVKSDSTLSAGMMLVNNALVQNYYSFDSVAVPVNSVLSDRQVYGPTGAATVQLTTAAPTALSKQAMVSTAALGQPFVYRITIPAAPQPTAVYDVQITDDISLATTGVSLSYVSASARLASGTKTWATLTNSGTATSLILIDTANGGLDIPAGDQLVVDVTVVLGNDIVNNIVGKQFSNTANYKYNRINNDNNSQAIGAPGASGPVTIVGPNLTLTKIGPNTMRVGTPGTFTLNMQNIGGAPAWNATLTDVLPNVTVPAKGGMCGSAPTNITARIYQADGTTPVSAPLANGADFTVNFTGSSGTPACTLTIAMRSTAATTIAPTNRLIVTYQASLDANSASGLALTNIAGATQYQSADPTATGASGNVHTITNTLTNGTPGILDFQDALTVTTESPVLTFTKTVYDVTTGQSGATARPGDTLKYTLTIQNIGTLAAANFSLTDELDRLNPSAMFVPGSLSLITVPSGANTSLTSPTGGSKGTGLVSIGNLNIDAQGGANDKLVVEFQARLKPVINSGARVLNQAQIGSPTLPTQLSDDPSISGTADPTLTIIVSAPVFRVLKSVTDITSGTSIVTAGDTLLYTVKVNNIGTENAVGVTLRDLVPANTSYVANTTKLNGLSVADVGSGVSPLQNGMPINSPSNLTPGVMPADASAVAGNTATVTFEVKISPNVVNGTIISNQGFVDGSGVGSGPFPEQPSDDPTTPIPNDPTSVVVGNVPLIYALKTVKLVVDNNGNGLVDPGDVLSYTITLTNSAATPATGVVLADVVPANTTYVANSTTLNGGPVTDPSAGVSPLAGGMGVVSAGLTPPSPPSAGGTIAAHGTGTVTFDVQVNAGVSPGTIISNQGAVAATGLTPLPTDSDGNPTNGYQPTVITVGNAQQISIIKSYAVLGGGTPLPGSTVEYTVQATNIGTVPATGVVITDDLTPISAQATYVAGSAAMNGSTNGVSYSSQVITANYGATYGALAPGSTVVLRFRVKLSSALTTSTSVTNTAQTSWNTPAQTATASVTLDSGSSPGSLSGRVWQDANFNNVMDGTEQAFAGWAADVYRDGQLLGTVYTATDGTYQVSGLASNAGTASRYEIRFRAPGAGSKTAMLGWANSPFTNGMQRISNIILPSGGSLQNMDLPLTPNGVVYNSVTRTPIAGAMLIMVQASTKSPLPGSCFGDPTQQGQVTLGNGFYKFDLNFSDSSACPSGGDYLIQVTPPSSGYTAGPSRLIPPTTDSATATFSVPTCPGSAVDAVLATPNYCEAQASALAPAASMSAGPGTTYYMHLTFDNAQPGDSQIYNNHLAVDPTLNTAIAITKTAALVNVVRGQMVPYTITLKNTLGVPLTNLSLVDTFPPGFKYVSGSGLVDGQKSEPVANTTQLVWNISQLAGNSSHTIKLLLVVGSGVSDSEYVNRAQVMDRATNGAVSGVASATVRVTPDPTMDCTDIIGKVFDDANANGYPDQDEKGLAGVRIVSARGLIATTDKYGRFHITCAAVPDEERGSNFILKLDDRSLPTGYRVTTENPLVLHLTRGKAMKFNFGAAMQRVVQLDIADGVFEPGTAVMREQWKSRLDMLMSELRKAPSILRISYLADVEDQSVVKARAEAVKHEIAERWGQGSYKLTIETEIFWRHGGPPGGKPMADGIPKSPVITAGTGTIAVPAPKDAADARVSEAPALGQAVEKQAGIDEPRTLWAQSGDSDGKKGDKIEVKKVPEKVVKTIKLQNLVPSIHFASGEAEIPDGYIQRLKDVLDSMKGKDNVRLHLVGHTDNAQLFGEVKKKYGDNLTLSRERAGIAAEYFQKALNLPPESVTYEGMGESQPIASNATEQGKAQNRRVEIEVWYDEIANKLVDKEVVVTEPMNRVKVCRVETVCKVRYKEGQSKRARIRNLVEPLHFDDDTTTIPEDFVQKVRQAFTNLGTKEHIVIKFIGYTDNMPLSGRAERIYGDLVALSKARARRAALAVQDALKLPASGIEVDGKGAANPIASNDTEKGRALNRRIEVEFWYDDALQVFSDEPQLCPEAAGAETVTRIYDPPSGGIKPILFEQGKPVITSDQLNSLRSSMDEIKGKEKVRLRFIGYTNDERLDRRTAMVYGDDIGLSTARARRAMNAVKGQMGLTDEQAEFEGHGFVQSGDVVNTGFVESDTARVEVQVVYDETLPLDGIDGLDITRLTREVTPKDPLALNLMRITVDGMPIDDPNKSIADIERCTDVALDKANVQFKFDNLDFKPRLNVTAWPNTIRYQDDPATEYPENLMRFRTYTNYAAFINRSEIRIFDKEVSVNGTPLAVIEVGKDGRAEWQPTFPDYKAPGRELKYVLRVYDADGHYDETKPLPIWITDRQSAEIQEHDSEKELLVGYGENHLSVDNIPKKGGTVKVYGSAVPADHSVFVAGHSVPVGNEGKFVTEEILPSGMHTVEVAILDKSGNGELFLRDLELKKSDWFLVGIADVTVSRDFTSGPAKEVTNDQTHYNNELSTDGRLAFYTKGKFGNGWELTSSADTLEEPLKDIFRNMGDKTPDSLFRTIDPKYFYPTYGDDGSVEEGAPTLGKFYLKVKKDDSYGMWGNFKINYGDNDLAHIDRGLYGANLRYQTLSTTSFGEKRFLFDGFAAQPGTVGTREEFLGTGGTLYYLHHQDVLNGSESVHIEIRDKDSGIVTAVKNLTPSLDYTVDYLQGRIVLSQPLSPTASDNMLVTSYNASGNRVYLVVRYEYVPSAGDTDSMSLGGQTHVWLNDYVKLGVTSSDDKGVDNPNKLNAADLTLRKSAESWIKVETSKSEGPSITALTSSDGGFTSSPTCPSYSVSANGVPTSNPACSYFGSPVPVSAGAYRIDTSLGFKDVFPNANGQMTLYMQSMGAGYSAPGIETATDTKQYGGTLKAPVTDKVDVTAKADKTTRQQGLNTDAAEVDLNYHLTEHWTLSPGVRIDNREDHSPVVPPTQVEGKQTDAALRATYDSKEQWSAFGFVQDTVDKTGNRESNGRIGSGGEYRVTDRLKLNGEVSSGDLGGAGKFGTEYLYSDRTNVYLNYVYDNETPDSGLRSNKGNFVSGFKTRYSDSASVYAEEKYTYGKVPTGLTHAAGVDLAPFDHWNFGVNVDFGTLRDPITDARLVRNAAGVRVGYSNKGLVWASAFEYRVDRTDYIIINPDGTTSVSTVDTDSWLVKNDLKYQIDDSSRVLGKYYHAQSSSSGAFFGGNYTEVVIGYGYRPISNDRLNTLFKYTYFYNVPTLTQVTDTVTSVASNTVTNTAADFIQKSHIISLDATYDLTKKWSIGGKYAYRLGEVSEDINTPVFFDSHASLYILRADWHFVELWDALVEARLLDLPDAHDKKSGILTAIYRKVGNNLKAGIGYNFSDFSDDLTQLSYKSQGLFINLVGEF